MAVCLHCVKDFQPRTSDVHQGFGRFCSHACAAANRKGEQRRRQPLAERFWQKVQRGTADECWPWLGAKKPTGYGIISAGGLHSAVLGAHRVSYELHYGPIPQGSFVMHECDNPPCVNPAHLSIGLPMHNTADMIAKGRHRTAPRIGVRNASAKLTDEQITDIRMMSANGAKTAVLGQLFGVTPGHIRKIVRGEAWSHITAPQAPEGTP
jgi:hypothetical protein